MELNRFRCFPLNRTPARRLLACTSQTELFLSIPLAQTIVTASRAEGFEPPKAEGLKASWENCQCKMFGL
jgi:Cd2+/Zn2+-exporting ATPase